MWNKEPSLEKEKEAVRGKKNPRLDEMIVGDTHTCCVCYQAFQEEEWVQCAYTRWLHEDCIVDSVVDQWKRVAMPPMFIV